MNELFWPSQTSEASGGSLVGTMSADRASGPQMPATYEQVLPVQSQEPQATPDVAGLSRVQAQGLAQDGQQAPPFKSITMKADGTFKMEGDQSMLAEVMGQLTDLKQMKTAAMARVAQLKQQEASGSPLIDALSTFAGNMAANDPKMPGWIRALGQTSLQMGPQGIRARREAEEQKALQLTKLTADTALDAAKLEDEKYKATLSMVERMRSDADKADKARTTTVIQMRKEGRAQIERSGNYDAEGLAAEMRAAGIPEEVISAQVESLAAYADEWNRYKASLAAAEDEKERRKVENQWARDERRFRESEERLTRVLTAGHSKFEFKNSVPTPKDVDALQGMAKMMEALNRAEGYLGKIPAQYRGGPIEGWLKGKNPWRDAKDDQAFAIGRDMTLQALKASGLAPISEVEFAGQENKVFDPKKTWAQNRAIIDKLRAETVAGMRRYMEWQPHRNWTVMAGVLPKELQGLLPELERRRAMMYSEMAPPGVPSGGTGFTLPDLEPGESITLPGGVILKAR